MASLTTTQLLDLSGQSAIVSGGAAGIGQAIASRLAEAGAAVMIADINGEAAQASATTLNSQGLKARAMRADVSQVADNQAVVDATVKAFGRLDILVNNAGIFPFMPALQMTEDLWDKVLGVNLKGAFFLAQAAARQMVAAERGGMIVNIASVDGVHPTGNLAEYDASKGGLIMLTKSLAVELARYHIRVNAVAPGGINTPGARAQTEQVLSATGAASAQITESFLARIPLGRMGEPDDIARAVLFLASQASSYMTGSLLVVDGGYLIS